MGAIVGIVAAILLLVCLLLSTGGCSRQAPSGSSGVAPVPPVVTSVEGMKSLDRTAIRVLLKKLADSPTPKAQAMGAMCYDMAPPPRRADYVCPSCGERTLYDESKWSNDEWVQKGVARVVAEEIPGCRREIEDLRRVVGDAISLDESQFCRKCSPKVARPKLMLRVFFEDGKPRDIENVSHSDLRILQEFLAGKQLTKGDNDSMLPLKDRLPRLQELLGVKIDE